VTQRRQPSATDRGRVAMNLALDEVGRAGWRSQMRSALVGALPRDTVEDVILVAGELVANAVEHGLPPASLELAAEPGGPVLVSVHDHGAPVPLAPTAFSHEAVRGRGLLIVDSLSSEWGVRETEHGKAVWARVAQQDEAGS
jgi:anti-sigma regulatory factor (Ser/Thr protein kinase)